MRLPLSTVAVLALALAACHDKNAPVAPTSEPAAPPAAAPSAAIPSTSGAAIDQLTFAPALGVDLRASTRSATGLYTRDTKVGTGEMIANGSHAFIRYALYLPDGTLLEESPAGDPGYELVVGQHNVIPAWEEGVIGMKVGGKRQLIAPPELAYGPVGQGKVPPNAVLVFSLELMSAK